MNTKRTGLHIVSIICLLLFCSPGFSEEGEGKGKKKNKPVWEATEWQCTLPTIKVMENDEQKEYTFISLIEADGYLCPGSARGYKALLEALPVLFKDEIPDKKDLRIIYGTSDCAKRVFTYFFGESFTSKTHLFLDDNLKGREIIIHRISTKEEVYFKFDTPDADGHTKEGALAGDKILKAEPGNGMIMEKRKTS